MERIKIDKGWFDYLPMGFGDRTLLTFHGFDQDHSYFSHFEVLNSQYTMYHFDLPLHGKSQWSEGVIEKEDIKSLFDLFFGDKRINRFSIGAFSLGGKVLLTLLELYPERIDALFLMGADGIKVNIWYKLATKNFIFRRLFKSMVEDPRLYFKVAEVLQDSGIVDRSMVKFARTHMKTMDQRQRVYRVWNTFKQLSVKEARIVELINNHQIYVYLYLGIYDRVIPKSKFNRFQKRINSLQYYPIPTGHNHLLREVAKRIAIDLDAQK